MRVAPFLVSLAAAMALALGSAPVQAGGLPPLDLKRGQGSVGFGVVSIGGDLAVADRFTVGVLAYNALLYSNLVVARATWTPIVGPYGSLALMGAGGMNYMGGAFAGIRESPFGAVGPAYESPPGPVGLRAYLLGGVMNTPVPLYDTGEQPIWGYGAYQDPVVIGVRTTTALMLLPGIEIVVPLGEHLEVTAFGNGIGGFHARW